MLYNLLSQLIFRHLCHILFFRTCIINMTTQMFIQCVYICNVYLLPTHFSNLENASLKTPLYAMPTNPHLMSTHHFMPTKHHFIPTKTPLYANKNITLCQQKHDFMLTKTQLYANNNTTLCQQKHHFMPTKNMRLQHMYTYSC